jgi:hypothetical protein
MLKLPAQTTRRFVSSDCIVGDSSLCQSFASQIMRGRLRTGSRRGGRASRHYLRMFAVRAAFNLIFGTGTWNDWVRDLAGSSSPSRSLLHIPR